MSEQIANNQDKCDACGGILSFSPEDKALKCASCGSIKQIEYDSNVVKHSVNDIDFKTEEYEDFKNRNKVFKCSSCGSSIVLNTLDVSRVCPYCGSPCTIDKKEKIGLKPDGIIPFKFGQDNAATYYKKGLKKMWFIPNVFKKSPPIEEIKGIYVPSFAYDAKTDTSYTARLGTTHRNSNGETYTSYRIVSGKLNMEHENILIETSSKMDQIVFNSIKPYNMSEIVKFKSSFILGYSVEHYTSQVKECKTIADEVMKQRIEYTALSKYSYDTVDYFKQETVFSDEKFSYFIVPTYQVNYTYKNKKYTTFMNGQTGKVGTGVPHSPIKITFFTLFMLSIIAAIVCLIVFCVD